MNSAVLSNATNALVSKSVDSSDLSDVEPLPHPNQAISKHAGTI